MTLSQTIPKLLSLRPCTEAREWLASLPPETSVEAAFIRCPDAYWVSWLLDELSVQVSPETLRPAVLRTARVHAAQVLDAAGLPEQAQALRGLADDASLAEIWAAARTAAVDAARAAAVDAARAAEAARTVRAAADAAWAARAADAARAAWAARAAQAALIAAGVLGQDPDAAYQTELRLCLTEIYADIGSALLEKLS